MTDHRHTIASFLRTDRFRMEAALEEKVWSKEVAERLTQHLRYAAQLQAVYLEGLHPKDPALQTKVTAIAPESLEEAVTLLAEQTESLVAALQQADDRRLHALVLDPHERELTVLGHFYDFSRSNAMLVEWARGLPGEPEQEVGTLRDLVGEANDI
ncbi:MAG: hypothetical protein M3220_11510 [Chloroflexota bacterium]|nr:hypothetical protein [Chloroflexota bacterium]